MRSNYRLWFAIGMLCFYTFINQELVFAADSDKDVALIYVTSNQQPNEDVIALQAILQSYTSVDVVSIEDINKQKLQPYKRVVVLNAYPTKLPPQALSALNQFKGFVLLIGDNALQFAPFSKWQEGPVVELRAIGEESLHSPVRWNSLLPTDDSKIIQRALSVNQSYPFIISKDKWSFIGEFINKDTWSYQWPAIIGELLQLPKPQVHPGYIVLTDINMKTDVQKLKEVVTGFSEKKIPIALEVTPIFMDEHEKKSYHLHDNKKLLSYLQQLQKENYPFILSSSTTIPIERSLDYLVLRKIYPTVINGDSPLFKGSIQQGNQQLYLSKSDNRIIYPITVGSIANTDNLPLYPVQQEIDRLLKVPSSIIGIQYPAYLNASYVEGLVAYLREHPQIEFFDFRHTKQQVTSENVSIVQDEKGKQTIHLSFSKLERLKISFDERPFELILWALVFIVSLFVTLFFISTLRLRITLRKRLFEERKTNG